ncbi:UNVERIFIED_CONTAM: hypothetical protein Slati_2685400 [Sesamum latifolium]|uniref:Uncharacterized protein n=1 Tax=Sesamum latifolium TaxID=2727402 RepID=A0AAW2W037_9LAMI
MVNDKPIMDQVHEYENLVADVLSEGMKMCDILQANVLFEKFPPTWSEYQNHLKYKKKDLNLQELINHMRTEEANRLKDKKISNSSISFKANLVGSTTSSNNRPQGVPMLPKKGSTKTESETSISTHPTNQSLAEQEEIIVVLVVEVWWKIKLNGY